MATNDLGVELYRDADEEEAFAADEGESPIPPPQAERAHRKTAPQGLCALALDGVAPLSQDSWFKPDLDRTTTERLLTGMPDGTFLIRMPSQDGAYCLSYNCEGQVHHMLIDKTADGQLAIRESLERFATLRQLVTFYHAPEQQDLLCPLAGTVTLNAPTPVNRELYSESAPAEETDDMGILGFGSYPWLMLSPYTKEEALQLLFNAPNGAFVVRSSFRVPECLSLSYVFDNNIYHELIGIDADETGREVGVHLLSEDHIVVPDIRSLVVCRASCSPSRLQAAPPGGSSRLLVQRGLRLLMLAQDFHIANRTVLLCHLVEHMPQAGFAAQQHRLHTMRSTRSMDGAVTGAFCRCPPWITQGRLPADSRLVGHAGYLRESAPWLVTGIPRDDAISLLFGKPEGSFLIRQSEESADVLVLCYVHDRKVHQVWSPMTRQLRLRSG